MATALTIYLTIVLCGCELFWQLYGMAVSSEIFWQFYCFFMSFLVNFVMSPCPTDGIFSCKNHLRCFWQLYCMALNFFDNCTVWLWTLQIYQEKVWQLYCGAFWQLYCGAFWQKYGSPKHTTQEFSLYMPYSLLSKQTRISQIVSKDINKSTAIATFQKNNEKRSWFRGTVLLSKSTTVQLSKSTTVQLSKSHTVQLSNFFLINL